MKTHSPFVSPSGPVVLDSATTLSPAMELLTEALMDIGLGEAAAAVTTINTIIVVTVKLISIPLGRRYNLINMNTVK